MNSAGLFPHPLLPVVAAILSCLTLLAFILWTEYIKNTKWFALRAFAAVCITLGLLGLSLRPALKRTQLSSTILVTENPDQAKIDSLVAEKPDLQRVELNSMSGNDLEKIATNVRYVVGDGLSPSELELMHQSRFNYFPSSLPPGIVKLTLPEKIFANQKVSITGIVKNAKPTTVILSAPNGKVDSVETTKGLAAFKLSFTPVAAGKFNYIVSAGPINETLAIAVSTPRRLRVLVLESFPTFELKYLKNFVSEKHDVVTRYQVSKDKYRIEYLNSRLTTFNRLDDATLRQLDLLILNFDAAKALSTFETASIRAAVDDGLGILLLGTNEVNEKKIEQLSGLHIKSHPKDTAVVRWQSKTFALPAARLQATEELDAIIRNKSRILAGVSVQRLGKVGLQLLQETYQLQLQGDTIEYAELWTRLIQKTSRTSPMATTISLPPSPVFEEQPATANITTAMGTVPSVFLDSVRLQVREDFYVDDLYRVQFRVNEPGWHSLRVNGDSSDHPFYVFSANSWKSLRAANNQIQTQRNSTSDPLQMHAKTVYTAIRPIVFFILLIAGMAILWVTPKL